MITMTVTHDLSQEEKSYELLRARSALWTPAPELAEISLQYCRAIAGLGRRGVEIENRVENRGRVRHGFYRLKQSKATAHTQPYLEPPAEHADLFPTLEPAVWRDPEES